MNSIRSMRWRIVHADCTKHFLGVIHITVGDAGETMKADRMRRVFQDSTYPQIPEKPCESCLHSGEESDVLSKRKNVDRKDWDLRSETEKVTEKRDEKLDDDQSFTVGTWPHWRDSRRA